MASSDVHAVIPADHPLIEGVVYDAKRSQLYATSVVGRKLLKIGKKGLQVVPVLDGIGSLLTGVYDRSRDRIWLVAAAVEQTPKEGGRFVGLVEFDPVTQSVLRKIPAPGGDPIGPNDIALAEDVHPVRQRHVDRSDLSMPSGLLNARELSPAEKPSQRARHCRFAGSKVALRRGLSLRPCGC